jgi:hypothetical protein
MWITITRKGEVTIKMEGFQGTQCLEASKNVEKALGAVDKRDDTPDMYQEAENVGTITNS